MYIIIAGSGRVGFHVASMLVEEGHEVAIMEEDEHVLEDVGRRLDIKAILGNAATPRVLREAEVNRADLIIAVTDSDETNVLACFLAKEAGASVAAARVRNPEYSGYFITPSTSPSATRRLIRMKSLGVDVFINPEFEAAKEISSYLSGFYPTPVENFADGRVQIREFVAEEASVVGKSVQDIPFPKPCVVAAITRATGVFMANPSDKVEQGDRVYLISSPDCMVELGQIFARPHRPAKSVIVFGAGYAGFLVAERLSRYGITVKVIDEDIDRCRGVAARLEEVTVLQGDGTDRDFLIEQGISAADAFVGTTDSDEANILSGFLAKNLGVDRSLIIVGKPSYIPLSEALGVTVAASPPLVTARKIAHFVLHGGAVTAAFLGGKDIQATEFVVNPKTSVIDRQINSVEFPKDSIIGAVVRNGEVFIPPGEIVLQSGDHVIVISPISSISNVEKLFK